MASVRIIAQLSPDLAQMMRFIDEATDRLCATDLQDDPRVRALMDDFDELVRRQVDVCESGEVRDGRIILEPTDALAAFVARFRALDHALFAADRARRGWG